MSIEPTSGGPTATDPDPQAATNGSKAERPGDAPAPAETPASAEASGAAADVAKPTVTRARAKTSGAAPRGRARSATTPARKAATKSEPKAVMLAPAAAIVPALDADPGARDVVRADRVEISQGGADRVEATTVSITQGGIGTADARTIDIHQGGIGRASGTDIAVSQGSIGFAQGERVSLEMGAIGAAMGDDVRVTQSMSGFIGARGEATVDQSLVSTLVADRVTIRQPSAVLLLIARQVDGTVRPLLDWRGAVAAGAVAGIVLALLRLGRR